MEETADRIKRGFEEIGEKLKELSDYKKQELEKRIVLAYAKEKSLWIADLSCISIARIS